MKLLVGECTGRLVPDIQARGWGRMWIARGRRIYTYAGEPWGFDNGAFACWKQQIAFDEDAYRRRVMHAALHPAPLLCIVPDLIGQGDASLAYSLRWLRDLPVGLPWYLAVQDGMTPAAIEPIATKFRGIFLGGTDRFKRQARAWCRLAHDCDLPFHYGRASRLERLEHALEIGADSADSTQFMWTRRKWAHLLRWWDETRPHQGRLFAPAAAR